MPASVAAAPFTKSTSSGIRTNASVPMTIFGPKPPSNDEPGHPADVVGQIATRSPTLKSVTPSPTALMTPASSWPSVTGTWPSMVIQPGSVRMPTSVWQMPAAFTSMTTLPGPALGSGSSSNLNGSFVPVNLQDFIFAPLHCRRYRASVHSRTAPLRFRFYATRQPSENQREHSHVTPLAHVSGSAIPLQNARKRLAPENPLMRRTTWRCGSGAPCCFPTAT